MDINGIESPFLLEAHQVIQTRTKDSESYLDSLAGIKSMSNCSNWLAADRNWRRRSPPAASFSQPQPPSAQCNRVWAGIFFSTANRRPASSISKTSYSTHRLPDLTDISSDEEALCPLRLLGPSHRGIRRRLPGGQTPPQRGRGATDKI